MPRSRPCLLVILVLAAAGCGRTSTPVEEPAPSVGPPAVETGLVGRVRWTADVPEPGPCGGAVLTGDDGGLAGVVVQIPGAIVEPPPVELTMRSVGDCGFEPRLAVVQQDAVLTVTGDATRMRSFHLRRVDGSRELNVQNLIVPPGQGSLSWTLNRPGLFHVTSDVDEGAEAWIHVGLPGAVATTGLDGRFALPDLAPGIWPVELWHESVGFKQHTVTVPPDGPASLYVDYPSP